MVVPFGVPDQIPSVFWRTDVQADMAGMEGALAQIVMFQGWVQQQIVSLFLLPMDIGKDVV